MKTLQTQPEAYQIAIGQHRYVAISEALTAVLPTILAYWDVTTGAWFPMLLHDDWTVPTALQCSSSGDTLCIISFSFIPSLFHHIINSTWSKPTSSYPHHRSVAILHLTTPLFKVMLAHLGPSRTFSGHPLRHPSFLLHWLFLLDCLTLRMNELQSSEMSETTQPITQCKSPPGYQHQRKNRNIMPFLVLSERSM